MQGSHDDVRRAKEVIQRNVMKADKLVLMSNAALVAHANLPSNIAGLVLCELAAQAENIRMGHQFNDVALDISQEVLDLEERRQLIVGLRKPPDDAATTK